MTFEGSLLRRIRDAKGWNQAELARRTGIAPGRICNYESDTEEPRLANLTALAEVLDVPTDLLVGRIRLDVSVRFEAVISAYALKAFVDRSGIDAKESLRLARIVAHPRSPKTAEGWHELREVIAMFLGRPRPAKVSADLSQKTHRLKRAR